MVSVLAFCCGGIQTGIITVFILNHCLKREMKKRPGMALSKPAALLLLLLLEVFEAFPY